jgi:sec-independent protein translocase protein TatC
MTQEDFGQNHNRPIPHSTSGGHSAPREARMAFFDHLDELRSRLMRCLYVFFAGFAGCYFIADQVMAFLRAPLFAIMPADQQKLYFTSLFENFLTHIKIAGYSAVFVLAPYFFYEIWGFISPGLHAREKKLVIPFVGGATFFFLVGASFAYYVLFPVGFQYFISYGGPGEIPLLTIESYYNTVLKLILLFGLAFELPVLICLLGALGVVDAAVLKEHRIGITIVAAMFAPPDAMSMILLGLPLVMLYEASIWVVGWMNRGRPPVIAAPEEPANPLHGGSDY